MWGTPYNTLQAHETPEIAAILGYVPDAAQYLDPATIATMEQLALATADDGTIIHPNSTPESDTLSITLLHKILAHLRSVYSAASPDLVPATPSIAACLTPRIIHAILTAAYDVFSMQPNVLSVSPAPETGCTCPAAAEPPVVSAGTLGSFCCAHSPDLAALRRGEPMQDSSSADELGICVAAAPRVVVVGDIHGVGHSLVTIIEANGLPTPQNRFIFNGDLVDRGPCSLEVVCAVLLMVVLFPNDVFIIRGNHETVECTRRYGFFIELYYKMFHRFALDVVRRRKAQDMGVQVGPEPTFAPSTVAQCYAHFLATFSAMPIAAVVSGVAFVAHGGLALRPTCSDGQATAGPADVLGIAELSSLHRFCDPARVRPETLTVRSIMWTDPSLPQPCLMYSLRGRGRPTFSAEACATFLQNERLQYMIRSHEMPPDGFASLYGGRLLTIFSSPQRFGSSINGFLMLATQRYAATGNGGDQQTLRLPAPQLVHVSATHTSSALRKAVLKAGHALAPSLVAWLTWIREAEATEKLAETGAELPVRDQVVVIRGVRVRRPDNSTVCRGTPSMTIAPREAILQRQGGGIMYGPLNPVAHYSVTPLVRPTSYPGSRGDAAADIETFWPLPAVFMDPSVVGRENDARPVETSRFCRGGFLHIRVDGSFRTFAF